MFAKLKLKWAEAEAKRVEIHNADREARRAILENMRSALVTKMETLGWAPIDNKIKRQSADFARDERMIGAIWFEKNGVLVEAVFTDKGSLNFKGL